MKFRYFLATVSVAMGLLPGAWAQDDEEVQLTMLEEPQTTGNETVVTADKLTFDYNDNFAVFENNVVVTDPELTLKSDLLTVLFDDGGQAKTIKAEGHVRIKQDDKFATSEEATYDVATGKIVLEKNPRVRRGRDVLEAITITFWRDQNKMICEPQAKLTIHPEENGGSGVGFGIE